MHTPDKLTAFLDKYDGLLHIIGIGGMAMSAIAEWLLLQGIKIQGSDIVTSPITCKLTKMGAKIFQGHLSQNIKGAKFIIKSSAILADNPEIIAAQALNLPVISRQEILRDILKYYEKVIAISGTHGKTTTTAMVATIFEEAGKNPTVFCGGEINQYKTNFKKGDIKVCIVEADESDATFYQIPYYAAVLTNIEEEHLDYYKTFSNLKKKNKNFIQKVPKEGFAVLNIDDPNLLELKNSLNLSTPNIITCSTGDNNADIQADKISYLPNSTFFSLSVNNKDNKNCSPPITFELNTLGKHNVQNALLAITVALKFDISLKVCKKALEMNFIGVKKRFSILGTVNGLTVIDDYAHHPTEISATLCSAKQFAASKPIVAIIQPHRYSRVKTLKAEFVQLLINLSYQIERTILLPIESGGENYIDNADSEALYNAPALHTAKSKGKLLYIKSISELLPQIKNLKLPSETLLVFMGAGNTTKIASNFFYSQIV